MQLILSKKTNKSIFQNVKQFLFLNPETLAGVDSQVNNVLTEHGKQRHVDDVTLLLSSYWEELIYCMLWWKGHFVQRRVMTDRPGYGSSSVCNEEMPRALIVLVGWGQWKWWWPVRQLYFVTYFFYSAPWDQRWSIPLHSQRGRSHHTIVRSQWTSQARCCLVQGRMSHSQSKSTFLDDFFGCIS